MGVWIKISGTWYETTAQKLKSLGGVWTGTMDQIHVKISGTWQKCLEVFAVTFQGAVNNGDSNLRVGTCYAGIKFDTNTYTYIHTASGGFSLKERWMTGEPSSDVWIVFTQTAGSTNWSNKTSGTRYNINVSQTWQLVATGGTTTITGYFRAYDASSGGNLLDTSDTATWTADDIT